jgi:hypothetical protein
MSDHLIYECGEGLRFSLEKEICDWEDEVECFDGSGGENDGDGSSSTEPTFMEALTSQEPLINVSPVGEADIESISQSTVPLNEQVEDSIQNQESSVVTRPPRPIRPVNTEEIVNIETRSDVLQITHDDDGTATLTITRPARPLEVETAADTIHTMSSIQPTPPPTNQSTLLPSYQPTQSPTYALDPISGLRYGPPLYYPNFAVRRCDSDPAYKPRWTSEEELFVTKRECCEEFFDWVDVNSCLGYGFVETNLLSGSPIGASVVESSTARPTVLVTASSTNGPTLSSSDEEDTVVRMSATIPMETIEDDSSSSLLTTEPSTSQEIDSNLLSPNDQDEVVIMMSATVPMQIVEEDSSSSLIAELSTSIPAASPSGSAADESTTTPSLSPSSNEPTTAPSQSPSTSPTFARDPVSGLRYGPPIYYPNFGLQKCDSDPSYKPKWTTSSEMFASKRACCETLFEHVIDDCLGVGFVEDNLVTDSPVTKNPTRSPTTFPSMSPSVVASDFPSVVPSNPTTTKPSAYPSEEPTFGDPTPAPSFVPTVQ